MKKVLIVEDDSAIIDIYETMIKKAKLDVQIAKSGQEAMKIIKDAATKVAKPDIVLLDLVLPDINGIEILKEIRKSETTKDIKVFILSNQQEQALPQLGDVKYDKFLIKANITPTQLVKLIKESLK